MGKKQTKQLIGDIRRTGQEYGEAIGGLRKERDAARGQLGSVITDLHGRGVSPGTRGAIDRVIGRTELPEEYSTGVRGLPTSRGPQFQGMLQDLTRSPGFSEAFKSAVAGETASALEGQFGNLRQDLAARVARTNNPAGYAAALGELGREEARSRAEANRRNLIDFENEERRRGLENIGLVRESEDERLRRMLVRLGLIKDEDVTEFGRGVTGVGLESDADRFERESLMGSIDALGQLYGIDTNLLMNIIGARGGLYGPQTTAAVQPGFWSRILPGIISGAAQVGSAGIAGGGGK